MKKGYLQKNKVFSINLLYIISILPVILYAYYKNGYLVYKSGFISFFLSTQYIVIPLIIIILSYIFEAYYYLGIKKEQTNNNVINSIIPFINTLCYLVCGPTNKLWLTIPLIIILDILLKIIDKKISINQVALFKCILFAVLSYLSINSNANYYEAVYELTHSTSELFIGEGIGEIGTTSSLCAIIGFIILLFNKYYKKDIPILSLIGYILVSGIIILVSSTSLNQILVNTFNSGFLFAIIFIASLSTATPVTNAGRTIYSLLVGILCAITINILNINIGIYIIILLLSILNPLFNKLKLSLD